MKAGDVMNVKNVVYIGWMITIVIAYVLQFIEIKSDGAENEMKRFVATIFKFFFFRYACAFSLCYLLLSL